MEKVISYINTNRGNGQKESLNRLRQLLERLGNPQNNLSYIHITGTNGKGSTASMFQSVLREADLKVGLFTSPHLEVVNERIRLNNESIKDEDLIRIVDQIEPVVLTLEEELKESFYAFELLTTVAFLYFQEMKPDVVILEAGIGGSLDSTNVIESSDVSVITSIGIDHASTLGNTKEAIMNEKVQILKEKGQMVIGPVEKSLKEVAVKWADKVKGELSFIKEKEIRVTEMTKDVQRFDYQHFKDEEISFIGKHQIENACVVLEACVILRAKGYLLTDEMIYRGLEKASWPGRFEKVLNQPVFYIDGAHNVASVTRLVETLEEVFPNEKFHFVVGMMKDKEYETMLKQVFHLAKEFILISPDPYRGFDTKEVVEWIRPYGISAVEVKTADGVLAYIESEIPKEDLVIQFGSLYLVGALKETLGRK